MNTLSPEQERQVTRAIRDMVTFVDSDGMSPSAALEKQATAEQWGPDMIRLAARAYNTGRQVAQLGDGTNVADKFASFPLADAESVLQKIWPDKVEAKTAQSVSSEYSQGPAWLVEKAAAEYQHQMELGERLLKTAALQLVTTNPAPAAAAKPASAPVSTVKPVAKTSSLVTPIEADYNTFRKLKTASERARADAAAAYDKLLAGMQQVRGYFSKFAKDRVSVAEADMVATTYWGEPGRQLMDWICLRNNLHEPRMDEVKLASTPPFDTKVEPWKSMQTCIQLGEDVCNKRAAHEAALDALDQHARTKMAAYVTTEVHKWDLFPAGDKTDLTREHNNWELVNAANGVEASNESNLQLFGARPRKESAPKVTNGWSPLDTDGESFLLKQSDLLAGLLGGELGGRHAAAGKAQASTQDRFAEKTQLSLEAPDHEARLRAIDSQASLAELMADDPVIGSYTPDEVAAAYNRISGSAPMTASQPMAMRALLRRHLQGNVEPFEVQQVGEMEKGLARSGGKGD